MPDLILKPLQCSNEVIVELSDTVIVDRNVYVNVPNGYKAFVFFDEKMKVRIEPCICMNILREYGRKVNGKSLKIAFVLAKSLPEMSWGFGNIPVNNERLKEAYRVGANGKYIIEISDYVQLIQSFSQSKVITIDNIRDKTISGLKTIGVPILSNKFANTTVSVFEINSLNDEIREDMLNALSEEKTFSNIGVQINSLTLEIIHVNADDLDIIRNRING